jgi:predicted O-methyltransferase YrrM
MVDEGVPASLVPALHYLIDAKVAASERGTLAPIDDLRSRVATRSDRKPLVFDSPHPLRPGEKDPVPGPVKTTEWCWTAERSSVTRHWGTFLFLCAKHSHPRTILELGGCAGISACYLAAASQSSRLITVEGSADLAAVAAANLREINPTAKVVNAMFDDALDQLLPALSGSLDLVHIDGQHNRASTIHYFDRFQPHLGRGALIIFDDIHWSDDMRRAWRDIAQTGGVSHAIDVGRYGVCVWKGDGSQPKQYNFARYTGEWRDENAPGFGK